MKKAALILSLLLGINTTLCGTVHAAEESTAEVSLSANDPYADSIHLHNGNATVVYNSFLTGEDYSGQSVCFPLFTFTNDSLDPLAVRDAFSFRAFQSGLSVNCYRAPRPGSEMESYFSRIDTQVIKDGSVTFGFDINLVNTTDPVLLYVENADADSRLILEIQLQTGQTLVVEAAPDTFGQGAEEHTEDIWKTRYEVLLEEYEALSAKYSEVLQLLALFGIEAPEESTTQVDEP